MRFAPRVWTMPLSEAKLGPWVAWEWDTPALVVWLIVVGVRVGWDVL